MKVIMPSYYPNFACIAGACRHSCCVGWEIDIDEDRLTEYRAAAGPQLWWVPPVPPLAIWSAA